MPKGGSKRRRKSTNSAKKKKAGETPANFRPSNSLLPAQIPGTNSSAPSVSSQVAPNIKREPTHLADDDDASNSDASTIPEAMDAQEGFCVSESGHVVNGVRVKRENSSEKPGSESSGVVIIGEEKSLPPIKSEPNDSDSDDSVIFIPVEKPAPKVLEILDDDGHSAVLPVPPQPIEKEEFIHNWQAQSGSFNVESVPVRIKTEKEDDKPNKIAEDNAPATNKLDVGGDRNLQEATAIPVKREPTNFVGNCGSVSGSISELGVPDATAPVGAVGLREIQRDASAVSIKHEPMDIADNSQNTSTPNLERSVSGVMIPVTATNGEQVEKQPDCQKKEATARIENKGKSKEEIEEGLKQLRARIKKEPSDDWMDVAHPKSNSTTLATSVQELENAVQKPKDSQTSNGTINAAEPEVEKNSSTEAQNSETAISNNLISEPQHVSTYLLKFFNLNTVITKNDAKECLNYSAKYEPKRDRFELFFEDFVRINISDTKSDEREHLVTITECNPTQEKMSLQTQLEKSFAPKVRIKAEKDNKEIPNEVAQHVVIQEPVKSVESGPLVTKVTEYSPTIKRIELHTRPKNSSSQKIKIKLEKDHRPISNKIGQRVIAQKPLLDLKPIFTPPPEDHIAKEQHPKTVTLPQEKVHRADNNAPEPAYEENSRHIPKGEKLLSSPRGSGSASVPTKEKLHEILQSANIGALIGALGETSHRINDQSNSQSSAIPSSPRLQESAVMSTIPSTVNSVLAVTPNLTYSADDFSRKRTFSIGEKDKTKKQKMDDPLLKPSACTTHLAPSTPNLVFPSGISPASIAIPQERPLPEIPHYPSAQDAVFLGGSRNNPNHPEYHHLPTGVNRLPGMRDPRLSKAEAVKCVTFGNRIGSPTTQLRYENVGKVSVTREFLSLILQWNPTWLQVQRETNQCPPICERYPLVRHTYDSVTHYYNTYMPLHMLSVWLRMFDAWKSGRQVHQCRCDKVETREGETSLTCSTSFLNEEGWPKREDIVLCIGRDSSSSFSFFGRVTSVMRARDKQTQAYKLKTQLNCLVLPEHFKLGMAVDLQILFNVRISQMQCHALENIHPDFRLLVLDPLANTRRIRFIDSTPQNDLRLLRDRIREAVLSKDTRAVLVNTSALQPTSDVPLLLVKVAYVLKNDFLVFLCIKSHQLFYDLLRRLVLYHPTLLVRVNEIPLNEELADLAKGSKERLAEVIRARCGIVITAFASFVPDDKSLKPAFDASRVVCLVDDADLCLEVESALPLRHKVDKLVLLGHPSRRAKLPPPLMDRRYETSLFGRLLQNATV